jgi:hypothetical protein
MKSGKPSFTHTIATMPSEADNGSKSTREVVLWHEAPSSAEGLIKSGMRKVNLKRYRTGEV